MFEGPPSEPTTGQDTSPEINPSISTPLVALKLEKAMRKIFKKHRMHLYGTSWSINKNAFQRSTARFILCWILESKQRIKERILLLYLRRT